MVLHAGSKENGSETPNAAFRAMSAPTQESNKNTRTNEVEKKQLHFRSACFFLRQWNFRSLPGSDFLDRSDHSNSLPRLVIFVARSLHCCFDSSSLSLRKFLIIFLVSFLRVCSDFPCHLLGYVIVRVRVCGLLGL